MGTEVEEVLEWRRRIRAELLAKRRNMPEADQRRVSLIVSSRIRAEFPELVREQVGFYWPIRGEIDLRPLATDLSNRGGDLGVPVITARNEPLCFARWTPDLAMIQGTWDIPIPLEPEWIRPTVLLVPVLGFDGDGYRLGYGGGYYDRTLSAMEPPPFAIGVGHEFGRLESIFPLAHDVALDAVITDAKLTRNGEGHSR